MPGHYIYLFITLLNFRSHQYSNRAFTDVKCNNYSNITVTTLLDLNTSLALIAMLWVICEMFVVHIINSFANIKNI